MSKPTNTDLIPFLNGTARVTTTSATDVSIVSDENQVLNGIEIDFRIHVTKRQYNDSWYCANIFAYRYDRQLEVLKPPATDNQKQKLYRAAVEVAEGLSAEFLRQGALVEAERKLERADDQVGAAKARRAEVLLEVEALMSEMVS